MGRAKRNPSLFSPHHDGFRWRSTHPTHLYLVLVRRYLRGQHLACRLNVDQRIDVEFGRNDIGPFVQDAMQRLIALDVEHGHRAATDPGVDLFADAGGLVFADPRPKALPPRGHFRWPLRPWIGDDEKQRHDGLPAITPARSS